jgi:Cytidylate kinase-like family
LTEPQQRRSVAGVTCKVVCISHETGADGAAVARRVADRLGFLYVDEEIVANAAAQGSLSPGDVADEERRKSLVLRILDAIAEGGGDAMALGGSVPYRSPDGSSSEIRTLIRETIAETAARGNVVIGAHAASHALGVRPDTLRVLVTASAHTRAKRVAEADGVGEKDALRAVRDADAGRRDYLNRFYAVEEELPTHYDLVVNTDALTLDHAAAIVATAAV